MNGKTPKLSKTERIARSQRNAAWRWGALIVGMLGLQVGLGVVAIVLATSDKSVAVVPDYYEKAMKWDEEVAARDASDSLGWTATVEYFSPDPPAAGLAIRLTDAEDHPVPIQSGRVRFYHHARAAEVFYHEVGVTRDGRVRCPDCFPNEGLWQVELDLVDGAGQRFVDSRTIEVALSGVALSADPPSSGIGAPTSAVRTGDETAPDDTARGG